MTYGKKLLGTLSLMAAALVAGPAQAGFVYVDSFPPVGSGALPISGLNNFGSQLAANGVTDMYLGRSIGSSGYQAGDWISVDLFAAEAGYRNLFWGNLSVLIDNQGNLDWSMREVGGFYATPGRLNFGFCAVNVGGCISNLTNETTRLGSEQSIGMWIGGAGNDTAWLLWDDSGAQSDDNHDDLIVRLTYHSVPEPGTLALLGLGLIGVALVRRRKVDAQV